MRRDIDKLRNNAKSPHDREAWSKVPANSNYSRLTEEFVTVLREHEKLKPLLRVAVAGMTGREFQMAISAALHRTAAVRHDGRSFRVQSVQQFLLRECVSLALALWTDVCEWVSSWPSQESGKVGMPVIMDDTSRGLVPERVRALEAYQVEHIDKTKEREMGYIGDLDTFYPPYIHLLQSTFVNQQPFQEFIKEAGWWIHSNLLHLAIHHGDLVEAKSLLHQPESKWKVDQIDLDGDTPLCVAVRRISLPGTRLLVDHGACVRPVNPSHGGTRNSPIKIAEDLWLGEIYPKIDLAEIIMCLGPLVDNLPSEIFKSPKSLAPEARYLFKWELPDVVTHLVKRQPDRTPRNVLQSYLVLAGSDTRFTCLTCADFVRCQWGEFGLALLDEIGHGLDEFMSVPKTTKEIKMRVGGSEGTTETSRPFIIGPPSFRVVGGMRISTTALMVYNFGVDANFYLVLQVFCWLTSAIRRDGPSSSSIPGHLFSSRVRVDRWLWEPPTTSDLTHYGVYQITPEALETLAESEIEGSRCWVNIFNTGIVTKQRLSSQRNWGRGLQIDFNLLVHLTTVGTYYLYKDRQGEGIILVGFRSALIPIAEKDGAIQWHFAHSKDGTINIQPVMEELGGQWLKILDLDRFQRIESCFVGWHEKAEILLGTKDGQYMLDLSDSTEIPRTFKLNGISVGLAGGFSGGAIAPISLNGQVVAQYVIHSFEQQLQASPEYEMALNTISSQVAFIYDTSASRAWLVPGLSLHLHLCHQYFFRNRDNWGATTNHIPFADISTNGSSAAIEALRKGRDVHVFQGAGDSGHDPHSHLPPNKTTLLDVFQMIHHNLMQSNKTREASSITMPWLRRNGQLRGTELVDMLGTTTLSTNMRQVDILAKKATPWASLADAADVVFVCSNIGHPIRPVPSQSTPSPKQLGCNCCVLPKDRYYLAAHAWCLERVLRKRKWVKKSATPPHTYHVDEKHWVIQPAKNGGRKSTWKVCYHHSVRSIWDKPERFVQDFSQRPEKQESRLDKKEWETRDDNQAIPTTGVLVFGSVEL